MILTSDNQTNDIIDSIISIYCTYSEEITCHIDTCTSGVQDKVPSLSQIIKIKTENNDIL